MLSEIIKYRYLPTSIKVPYLILFITSRCNFRCPSCFNLRNIGKENNDLTTDELKKISHSVGPLLWLSLSGGEPFLRDDLADVSVEFFKQTHFKRFNIPTNGFLVKKIVNTTEEMLQQITCDFSITISIDGIGRDHDDLRGTPGSFERLVETANRLKELKTNYPWLSVKANTVISNRNYRRIKEIGQYVRERLSLDYHAFELVRNPPEDSGIHPPLVDDCAKIYRQVRQIWKSYPQYESNQGIVTNFLAKGLYKYLHEVHLKSLATESQAIPCLAGQVSGVIYEDGLVALCETLSPIGNLREVDYDFDKIWFSPQADQMRKKIKEGGCHCTHTCFQFTSALFNPKQYFKILAAGFK